MTRLAREAAAALPAPVSDDLDPIDALRSDLLDADFTNAGVAALLGEDAVAALQREQVVPGQLRVTELLAQAETGDGPVTADGTALMKPCAVLTGLWLLDVDVTVAQVDAALPRLGVEGLCALGLAHRDQQWCRPSVDLRPYGAEQGSGDRDLWVLSDLSAHQVRGPLPADHVLGIGRASLTLASITRRRPVEHALDIGTGSGIQLFHLLDHAEHVVATDVSPRALAFARFNLLLNASTLRLDPHHLEQRVELLQGSLLEPVAGRRFDMIVSNPPFVVTPRATEDRVGERYTYRDGGRTGDELMAELITGLPGVLAPGGTAQMLGNWEIHADGGWDVRPRRWVEQSGLDAWFIQRDLQDGPSYAETWLADASEQRDLGELRRRFADYVEDFSARGVEGVGFGMIWLHRPTSDLGERWRRFEEITHPVDQPLGAAVGRTVERALAVAEQHPVLDRLLVVAADVTEERHQRFGAQDPQVILARQGGGLRRARQVSTGAAGVLGAADGDFTAGQLITAVAALLDDGVLDVGDVTADLRQEVVELYVDGFLDDVHDAS